MDEAGPNKLSDNEEMGMGIALEMGGSSIKLHRDEGLVSIPDGGVRRVGDRVDEYGVRRHPAQGLVHHTGSLL